MPSTRTYLTEKALSVMTKRELSAGGDEVADPGARAACLRAPTPTRLRLRGSRWLRELPTRTGSQCAGSLPGRTRSPSPRSRQRLRRCHQTGGRPTPSVPARERDSPYAAGENDAAASWPMAWACVKQGGRVFHSCSSITTVPYLPTTNTTNVPGNVGALGLGSAADGAGLSPNCAAERNTR